MFPIFPLIPVAGAISIDAFQKCVDFICAKIFLYWIQRVQDLSKVKIFDYRRIVTAIAAVAILASSLVGCSRILALHFGMENYSCLVTEY